MPVGPLPSQIAGLGDTGELTDGLSRDPGRQGGEQDTSDASRQEQDVSSHVFSQGSLQSTSNALSKQGLPPNSTSIHSLPAHRETTDTDSMATGPTMVIPNDFDPSPVEPKERLDTIPANGVDSEKEGKDLRPHELDPNAVPALGAAARDPETLSNCSTQVPLEREPEDSKDYPDGGYGWVIVLCGFLLNFSTWGVNTSFGIYLSFDLEQNYFPGATATDYAFVGALGLSMALAIAPLSNALSRRYHWRFSLVIGTICVVAGQILAGFAREIWHLYLTQGVLFAMGLGMCMVVSGPIVSQWFGLKRAFAVGILSAGSGGGALFFSNVTRVTMEQLGRRWACVINGCVSFAGLLPAIILFRRFAKPPSDLSSIPTLAHTNALARATKLQVRFVPFQLSFFRNPGFVCMVLWGVFVLLAYAIGIYSIPTYAVQGLGLSQKDGATLQSLLALGQLVGRPSTGLILDKVGRFNGAIATTLMTAIATLCIWLVASNFAILAVASVLLGATSGVFWSTSQALLTDLVGIRDMASALSVLWVSLVAPATVSEPIAIWLIDYSRDKLGYTGTKAFRAAIIFSGVAYFAGAVALCGTKRYKQGNWTVWRKT